MRPQATRDLRVRSCSRGAREDVAVGRDVLVVSCGRPRLFQPACVQEFLRFLVASFDWLRLCCLFGRSFRCLLARCFRNLGAFIRVGGLVNRVRNNPCTCVPLSLHQTIRRKHANEGVRERERARARGWGGGGEQEMTEDENNRRSEVHFSCSYDWEICC